MKIAISSGHGSKIRGASGKSCGSWGLDEVDEARRQVAQLADELRRRGVTVYGPFNDDISDDQSENLNRITNWHNSQPAHDLDLSCHFNANACTSSAMGCEVLYVTQEELARDVSAAIAAAGHFKDRGPKYRSDLYVLNNTNAPAILTETAFVDSKADADLWRQHFAAICSAMADAISGVAVSPPEEIEEPDEPEIDRGEHDQIGLGDEGDDVIILQERLGVLVPDGDFGKITDTWVRAFQKACALSADGIVGPKTWAEVDDLHRRVASGPLPLPRELVERICIIAYDSAIYDYAWPDRGLPYPGFIPGMACCFAYAMRLQGGAATVMAMAAGDPNTDALAWYKSEFAALGMSNGVAGIDTLRHLFVMMIGLGPRESSGKYCEGRDMSADNVQSDTAEAGLFQTSWNIENAHPSIYPMLDEFWHNPNGFLAEFKDGTPATASNLDSYGSGDGIRYQFLSRFCPLFHVMVTAVGMRTLRQHWGPINRREVTLKKEADDMLRKVQDLVDSVA